MASTINNNTSDVWKFLPKLGESNLAKASNITSNTNPKFHLPSHLFCSSLYHYYKITAPQSALSGSCTCERQFSMLTSSIYLFFKPKVWSICSYFIHLIHLRQCRVLKYLAFLKNHYLYYSKFNVRQISLQYFRHGNNTYILKTCCHRM